MKRIKVTIKGTSPLIMNKIKIVNNYKKLREIELKKNPTEEDKKLFLILHEKVFGFREPLRRGVK